MDYVQRRYGARHHRRTTGSARSLISSRSAASLRTPWFWSPPMRSLLSERDYLGQGYRAPVQRKLAHCRLSLHFPRQGARAGSAPASSRRLSTSCPTVLRRMDAPIPPKVCGASLMPLVQMRAPTATMGLFGVHAMTVNVTDGHYFSSARRCRAASSLVSEYAAIPLYTIRHKMGTIFRTRLSAADSWHQLPVYKILCKPATSTSARTAGRGATRSSSTLPSYGQTHNLVGEDAA